MKPLRETSQYHLAVADGSRDFRLAKIKIGNVQDPIRHREISSGNSQQRANPAPINLDGSSSDVTSAFRDEKSRESSKLSRLAQPLHRNLLLPSCLECRRTDSFFRR